MRCKYSILSGYCKSSIDSTLIKKHKKEAKSFGFDIFTSQKIAKVFVFVNIDKQSKLDLKLIRFIVLLGIL